MRSHPTPTRPRGGPQPVVRRLTATVAGALGGLVLAAALHGQTLKPIPAVHGARAGATVTVEMTGLAAGIPTVVGFGGLGTPHEILERLVADDDGGFRVEVTIPEWVDPNRTYFFFWGLADARPRGFSDPFIATGADGAVTVRGTLTSSSATCAVLTAVNETTYALMGSTGEAEVGARVIVQGTLAERGAAGPAGGPCTPEGAIPVRVVSVRAG